MRARLGGFTLIELIMVITITGIIGAIVAVFLQAPVRQYTDVARRADMTDVADSALRLIVRDLRLALPNSVRVSGSCQGNDACYLEFIPALDGGRYRAAGPGDSLDLTTTDSSFDVLGPVPALSNGDQIVVYNLGIARSQLPAPPDPCATAGLPANCGTSAYEGDNRSAFSSLSGSTVTIAARQFPFDSPSHRFHVIRTPVTYVCMPAAGGAGGTLTRYWGYATQATTQPASTALAPLSGASHALLAKYVSSCRFKYGGTHIAQRYGLVTLHLGITEAVAGGGAESITLYAAAHVDNLP